MELKEGIYVRTKKGYIAKILGVDYLLDDNGCKLNNIEAIYLDKMVDEIGKDIYAGCVSQVFKECRVSDNLIDLIEVGDYVNGRLFHNELVWTTNYGWIGIEELEEKDIKSIVTKEQFNFVRYEVK